MVNFFEMFKFNDYYWGMCIVLGFVSFWVEVLINLKRLCNVLVFFVFVMWFENVENYIIESLFSLKC